MCTCTKHVLSVPHEKPPLVARRRAGFRSREFSSRPPPPGKTPAHYLPESPPEKSRLFWPPGPRTGRCPPDAHQRKGRFRPKSRHAKRNSAETFQARNDLVATLGGCTNFGGTVIVAEGLRWASPRPPRSDHQRREGMRPARDRGRRQRELKKCVRYQAGTRSSFRARFRGRNTSWP